MLEHLRAPFKKLIEPLAKALISIGLTANAVTVIGTIGTIVVAFVTGITGWLFAGAVVLTLLVLADSLDPIRRFSGFHVGSYRRLGVACRSDRLLHLARRLVV